MDEREVRKDERKRVKRWASEWKKENEAIVKRRQGLIDKNVKAGMSPVDAVADANAKVCEYFGITPRRIRNIESRVVGFQSPGMRALTEAHFTKHIARLMADVDDAREHAEQELDKIDAAEEDGWLEVEIEESDKYGSKTKKIPVAEARKRWLEKRLEYDQNIFSAIRSFLPQTVVQTLVDNRSAVDEYTLRELDEQIKVEENKLKGGGADSA